MSNAYGDGLAATRIAAVLAAVLPQSGMFRCEVQVRYHHRAAPCSVSVADGLAEVCFDEPQLAVAPGQGAAFYRGELLLGGGWIAATEAVRACSEVAVSRSRPDSGDPAQ